MAIPLLKLQHAASRALDVWDDLTEQHDPMMLLTELEKRHGVTIRCYGYRDFMGLTRANKQRAVAMSKKFNAAVNGGYAEPSPDGLKQWLEARGSL